MVEMPAWADGARALARARGRADAGLHLDLGTRSAAELLALAARGALGLVDEDRVADRVAAQLDRFEAATAAHRPPSSTATTTSTSSARCATRSSACSATRYGDRAPYVRNVVPLRPRGTQGGHRRRRWGRARCSGGSRRRASPTTPTSPASTTSRRAPTSPASLRGWLGDLADGGLVMCHPGLPGEGPVAAARGAELRHLESDRFADDCAAAGVRLVRPSEASP